jgi:hypothetical protein
MKVYNGQEDETRAQSKKNHKSVVLATGLNNLFTNGDINKSNLD